MILCIKMERGILEIVFENFFKHSREYSWLKGRKRISRVFISQRPNQWPCWTIWFKRWKICRVRFSALYVWKDRVTRSLGRKLSKKFGFLTISYCQLFYWEFNTNKEPSNAHMCNSCSKFFCYHCVSTWLTTKRECPHCRTDLNQVRFIFWTIW